MRCAQTLRWGINGRLLPQPEVGMAGPFLPPTHTVPEAGGRLLWLERDFKYIIVGYYMFRILSCTHCRA